jgi:hypothetical protein
MPASKYFVSYANTCPGVVGFAVWVGFVAVPVELLPGFPLLIIILVDGGCLLTEDKLTRASQMAVQEQVPSQGIVPDPLQCYG